MSVRLPEPYYPFRLQPIVLTDTKSLRMETAGETFARLCAGEDYQIGRSPANEEYLFNRALVEYVQRKGDLKDRYAVWKFCTAFMNSYLDELMWYRDHAVEKENASETA